MSPTHILTTSTFIKNSNDEMLLAKTYNSSGGNRKNLVETVI